MRISIIIPVYNASLFLKCALDSVVAQTFPGWECICVDDGSQDDSGRILDAYCRDDGRFRVVHQENAGVSVARNRGLELARGEYICFMDADDTVESDWLEQYAKCVEDHAVDVVRVKRPWWNVVPGLVAADRFMDWCWKEWVREGYPWTYAIRREVAVKERFQIGVRMSEDQLYIAQLVPRIKTAFQLTNCGYNHRVHPGSAMARPLPSAERLVYLQTVERIADSDSAPAEEIARLVSMAIVTWLNRWMDSECAAAIRQTWERLAVRGLAKPVGVPGLYRLAYIVYAQTGWIWPGRFWGRCIRLMVSVKKCIGTR